MRINFFTGLSIWMILLFWFLLTRLLLIYFLYSIRLTLAFNSLLKSKSMLLFLFLICWFLNIKTTFQEVSSEKTFSVSPSLQAPSSHPPQLKRAALYTYIFRTLEICSDPSDLSNEFNCFKSLAVSQGYNYSVIHKDFNSFKNLKRSTSFSNESCGNYIVLPFYFPFLSKFQKRFHVLALKYVLNKLMKLNSLLLKTLFFLRVGESFVSSLVLHVISVILSK